MDLFLNYGFAWFSVVLTVLLSVIYIFARLMKKSNKCKNILKNKNRILRKHHICFGVLLIVMGFIHGLFSSDPLISLNPGTYAWILSLLLGFNYLFRKSFSKVKGWIYYHRILTAVFIAVLVLHIIDVGIQAPQILLDSFGSEPQSIITIDDETLDAVDKLFDGADLKDGIYEGEADGYRPGIKVSVEVKNNTIISIQVTNHNEVNSRFYSKAVNQTPRDIIGSQSLQVDTISGATMTSTGIINAVNDALSQALISGNLPEQRPLPQENHRRR